MKTKIIFRIKSDRRDVLEEAANKINEGEMVVIPQDVEILIKDKEGYWRIVE